MLNLLAKSTRDAQSSSKAKRDAQCAVQSIFRDVVVCCLMEEYLETDSGFQTDPGITDPFRGVAECLLSLGLARPANLLLRGVGLLVMMFS